MIANANISCPGPSQLQRFLNGELNESEQQAVDQHVETCAACQVELDRLTSGVAEGLSIPPLSAAFPATLARDAATAPPKADWPTVAGYTIRRELGRGARGIVYLADDARLKRPVAVKVIKQGIDLLPREISRFRTEAEAMARLRHNNIIPIYDVGENEGRPFLAMEYLEGGSLGDAVGASPQPPRTAAALVETLAKAMHHAHQRGVIHRDLKPGNVMLAADAEHRGDASAERTMSYVPDPARVKITDFGLAKLIDDDGESTGISMPGVPMGTPSYMSPEQAKGDVHEIGTRSDVYSLGAVLYKLLTGHAPYEGTSEWEILDKVKSRTEAPMPPRRRRPDIPRAVEAICLKCLEKEPARRYPGADVLASELRRYLNGDALRYTGRVSLAERMWRWGRRNPAWATAAGLAVALLGGMVVVPTVMAYKNGEYNRELTKALRETQYQLAVNHLDQGLSLCEQGNGGFGVLKLAQGLAKTPHDAHDLERVFRTNLASWPDRLHTLDAMLDHGAEVQAVALSRDGKTVISGGADGTAHLWDARTGDVLRVLRQPSTVLAAAFHPHAPIAVTTGTDGTAILWDTRTGEAVGATMKHDGEIRAVAFSHDGSTILTGSADGTARLWDSKTGKALSRSFFGHKREINCVAFHPNGTRVLTSSGDRTAQQWDVATGERIGEALPHTMWVFCGGYSPDGATIVTTAGGYAHRWDASTGRPIRHPLAHQGVIHAAVFSPDGRSLWTAGSDKTCRQWDLRTGRTLGQLLLHSGFVHALAVSANGQTIVTGSADNLARVWSVASGKPLGIARWHHERPVRAAAFSSDGRRTVTGSADCTARLGNPVTGELVQTLKHRDAINCVAFSADGKTLVTGSSDRFAHAWNAESGTLIRSQLHGSDVHAVALDPSGKIALTGSQDGSAFLWHIDTGKTYALLHGLGVKSAVFSPDGRTAVTGCSDGNARLWDAHTGEQIAILPHDYEVSLVAFSSDGRTVLTTSKDKRARLWNVGVNPPFVIAVLTHQNDIRAAALSSDGKFALTGSKDNTARLWNVETGHSLGPSLWHPDEVHAVAFSPDGRFALTGCDDCTVRLWDIQTGKPCGAPLPHDAEIRSLTVSPCGTLILSGSALGDCVLWKMPVAIAGEKAKVNLWTQVISGIRLDDGGTIEIIDAAVWRQCRRKLESFGGTQRQ